MRSASNAPRYPAPTVPSVTFPTPNLDDRILVEVHDHAQARVGPQRLYDPLELPEYGIAHPDTEKYPGYVLSFITPEDSFPERGHWFKWYWLNERANQDEYNYEIEYPVGVTAFPKVTRTYVYLRGTWVEPEAATLAVAQADPVFTDLVLTAHRMARTGDPVTDSLFIVVQRNYEKMPGVLLTYNFYDSLTDTTIVETRQRVLYDTALPTITDLLTDFQSIPESKVVKMFITRTYPSDITDKSITEFRRERFVYPAIMVGISTASLTKLDHTKTAKVTPLILAERPKMVAHKLVTTFQTTSPTESEMMSGIYLIEPVRHSYDGVFFRVVTGPVLCDAVSLSYTTGTSDPVWGDGVIETYEKEASVPTKTAYLADRDAGSWKTIDREFKKIAHSLWMQTDISIPIL